MPWAGNFVGGPLWTNECEMVHMFISKLSLQLTIHSVSEADSLPMCLAAIPVTRFMGQSSPLLFSLVFNNQFQHYVLPEALEWYAKKIYQKKKRVYSQFLLV